MFLFSWRVVLGFALALLSLARSPWSETITDSYLNNGFAFHLLVTYWLSVLSWCEIDYKMTFEVSQFVIRYPH